MAHSQSNRVIVTAAIYKNNLANIHYSGKRRREKTEYRDRQRQKSISLESTHFEESVSAEGLNSCR
jgi:hypothetical protein